MKTEDEIKQDLEKLKKDLDIAKQQVNIIIGAIMAHEKILKDGKE